VGWLSRAKKRYSRSRRSSSRHSSSRHSSSRHSGGLSGALSNVASKISTSAKDYASSRNHSSSSSHSSTPTWQNKLNSYAKDHNAGNAEIKRAQQVYEQKKRAGDMQGAEAAHKWANQVRDSMGTSGGYDRTTGASKGHSNNYTPTPKPQPTWQDKLRGYSSDRNSLNSELDRVKKTISSGSATDMNSAKKYLNQLNAIGDGMNANDVVGGKYDNYKQINNQNDMQEAVSQRSGNSQYTGKYADTINKAAKQYGLDPSLIASIITRESSFNPNAKSSAGAGGLMQLMPGTASGLGVKNAYDPVDNIMGGSKYLKQMIDRFDGDVNKALAAYNAGPNRKHMPKESVDYANNVLATFKELTGLDYGSDMVGQSQQPQIPGYEQKLNGFANDIEKAKVDRKRVIDVMNSGNAKDMEAARRYLNQLDTIIRGGSVQDALGGNYNTPVNDNDYAMSLDQRGRLAYYRDNKGAYDADVNRTLDKLEYGEAEDPQLSEQWLNRIDWANKGADIEDIVAGKYDGQEAYPDEEAQPAMSMNTEYEEQLSEKDKMIEALREAIEKQDDSEEMYNKIINDYDSYQQEVPDVYDYDEAMGMAKDQLNPLYDDTLKGALNAVDNNNLQRGFFGQMPGAELERSTASDIESKRAGALANLAQTLMNNSKDYSQQIINSNRQDQQTKLSLMLQGLMGKQNMRQNNINNKLGMLDYTDRREDKLWDREDKERDRAIVEADITGYYKGEPTLGYQKFLEEMGIKKEKARQDAEYNSARIQKMQTDVQISIEKLKNDRTRLSQTAASLGMRADQMLLNSRKASMDLMNKAQGMASKYFKDTGDGDVPNSDQYEKKVRYYVGVLTGEVSLDQANKGDNEKVDNLKKSGAIK